MRTYYKYLSFIDDQTFSEPTVRLSVPRHLNDPFESAICKTISDDLENTKDKSLMDRVYSGFINFLTHRGINQYGIVSLSETSSNLLMWAHYANEHKGICIGYKEDFLDSLEKPKLNYNAHYKPTRVLYDTLRYNKNEINEKLTDAVSELHFKILTKKSNDWMYEKEHRCIVPLYWADHIKYIGNTPPILNDALNGDSKFHESIKIRDERKIGVDREYIIDDEEGLELKFMLSHNKNSVFLKKINPLKIEKIYFGCRFPQAKLDRYVDEIKKTDHCLHHVKLYKYELDEYRFELKEKHLNP